MPEREKLFELLNFIMNEATDGELEVIVEALKRRLKDESKGILGVNPGRLAQAKASEISDQVKGSVSQVRDMIRGYVAELIQREAPDIPEEQLKELLDTWVPEPGASGKKSGASGSSGSPGGQAGVSAGGEGGERTGGLPEDVLVTMIRQFVQYGTGTMSGTEQYKLHEEIPDWQEQYWERFPRDIREYISLFIKGKIDEDTFWKRVYAYFGNTYFGA